MDCKLCGLHIMNSAMSQPHQQEMTNENFERIAVLCASRFHELYDDLVQDIVKYMQDEVNKIVDEREREAVMLLMNEELSELTDE